MKINCLLRFALVTVFGFALMLRADDQNEICEICTVGWPTPGAIFLENCEKLKDKELTAQITCISTPYGTARGHFSARKAIKTANGRYLPQTIELSGICGHSKCVKRSFDVPVLFPGETGTAKPTPGVNSLHWSVGLGRVSGNRIGGCLTLDSMDINDRLGKPESLHLAAQGMNDVVLAPFGQYVYQVLAPECFVQISEISHWSYSIEFYSPDQVSETRRTQLWHIGKRGEERIVTTLPFVSDGINSMTVVSTECYAIEESAVPFATFTVGQSGPGGMVSIVESRPGIENRTTAFAFANGTWTMNESGLRITSVSEEVGESKVKTRIVAGPNGESVETRQTYIPFEDTELLVEETVDPNGLARTTTWEYYTSGGNAVRGQLKKTIGPDGDWTSYVYDGEGRIAEQRNGWLSGNENEPSRVVRYEYAPFLATNDVSETKPFDDGKTDPTTARVETMLIGSVPVSKTLRNVALDSFGYRIIETVRLLNPAETNLVAAWNDPRNSRSLSIYMPDSDYKPCSRLPFLLVEENGTAAHYDYCSGSYTPGENGLPGTFEPVVGGSVFQTTITYGTRESFRLDENGNSASGYLGIPFQTTREVKLETRIGKHEIQTETFVCAESGTFERIAWTTKTLDSLGRVVSSRSSSGMETRKGWIGDNIAWEEDEEGIVRHYAYDALGRRTSESFVDPISSKQCVTSFEYDALDHHISKMVEADGLISVTTKTYDNCGRLVADCDGKGITTVYSYGKTPDNLLWKQTISGAGTGLGSTNVTYSFLDGQTAFETRNGKRTFTSAFGVGVTDFPYSKWQVDYLGSSGLDSPSWSAVLSDSLDRTTFGLQSAANNSVVVQSYGYDTSGNIVDVREFHAPMETNGVSSLVDVVASMVLQRSTNTVSRQLSTYDDFGNLVLTAVDVNRNGIIDLSGPDIVFSNAVSYCRVNGDWWKATEEFCFPETDSSFPVTNKVLLERMSGLGGQNATDCGSGVLFAQTKEIDGLGNERVACSYVDRINHRTFVIDSISGLSTKSYVVSMDGAIVSNRTSSGVCSSREYDALRRITAIVDGRGAKTRATYDSVGRIASTIVQGGALETYDYDEMNRPIRVENQNGEVTYLSYDTEGRIVSRRGALHPADCSYDENGKLASFTTYRDDSLTGGDTTFRTYDPSTGLLLSIVYADGKETTFAYDAVGNLVSRTWARGVTTAYGYDELNRIVTVDYSDGTPGVRYAYDRVGNVVSAIVEGVSTNLYYYNRYGDVTNEVQNGVSIVRNYDQYGRPTGYIIPGASCTGANVVYSYDGQGRIASVISGPHRFDYTFVPGLNEPLSMQTEAGFSWNRRLDDVSSQIVESANHYGTNLISRYSYGLDSLGHRVSRHEEGLAFPIETEEFFEYNDRSELTNSTRFCITGSGTRIPWRGSRLEYRYDQAGNRISDSEFAGDETLVQHYAVNELNQYVSVDNPDSMAVRGVVSGNSVVSVNGRTACQTFVDGTLSVWDATIPRTALGSGFIDFTCLAVQSPESGLDIVQETPGILYLPASEQSFQYDADGNMVSDGRWQYSWNADNRMTEARELVSVNPNSVRILRYAYDHRGRMVSKSVFVNSNLVERREYVWDGFYIICENTTRGADSSHRWNVWGLDASSGLQASGGAGGLLAVCESETIFYPAYDGNFNIVQYVDGSGDIVASAEFDPYGKPLVFDNATKRFTHWFGTMPWCEHTKLSEYLYRSYSPHLGRWLSRDPMGEQEFSLYSYVLNNPVDSYDSFGLWKLHFAVDKKWSIGRRGYFIISGKADLINGNGSLGLTLAGGVSFFITELIPGLGPVAGTVIGAFLEKHDFHQQVRIGGEGTGVVNCSCPDAEKAIVCKITKLEAKLLAQARIGFDNGRYRAIASVSAGGKWNALTGTTSFFGTWNVRAQKRFLGLWVGFSKGPDEDVNFGNLPFDLPKLTKTSFQIPLPTTCACQNSDVSGSSLLKGLLP